MRRVLGFLRYIMLEFGPLIVFWAALSLFGLKPAIGATVAFILLDALYRWRRKRASMCSRARSPWSSARSTCGLPIP
jgi:hypothetical protein